MKTAGFFQHAAMTLLLIMVAQGAWATVAVYGKLPGAFSVSATKQVWFSQGNLQYQANSTGAASAPYTGVWRFATNQYEAIGSGNSNVSASYDGWIDSFGWGSGNQPTQTSEASNVYSTFVDWGTNAISNGGNTANLWRTLSESEWTYLVFTRPNASSKRGRATINGMYCFVLLPDDWVLPSGLSFTPDANNWTNEYTTEQWIQMEDAGAVCFPAAGSRAGGTNNTNVNDYNRWCCYWSSTSANSSQGYNLWITSDHVGTTDKGNYQMGASVRLVSETMFPGSGTEEVPYLISSEAAWNYLADQVSAGNTYSGKYFQLTEDIGTEQEPITRMIGVFSSTASDCRPFSGNFDGNGHTLTVNYSSNDHETRTALFSYVKVATIRNLIVAGNCGSAGRAAGIVGESDESDGLNTITNCVSSVTISGGLVGGIALGGNVDIRGSLFNGTINGTSQSGGIVCWGKNVTKITNCLFAPQAGSSIIGGTFYCTDGGAATVTNCYYTTALGTAQGTLATFSSDKPANIGTQTAVYSVSGITAYTNGLYRGSQYICGSPEYNYSLPVTSATVLGESKFVTTFYHGTLHYLLPAGALAYTAGKDVDKVVFYRIGPNSNVIPADTAVIIVADSSGDITLTRLSSTTVTAKAGNILHGSDTDYTVPSGTAYVLGVVGGTLGFYPITGNTVPAGKAYYVVN